MNDVAKHLAINFSTQRDADQYIIDHATYFKCIYKTHRTEEVSGKFNDITAARTAATFTSKLLPLSRVRKNNKPITVKAYLESGGRVFDAVVEEIKMPQADEEVANGKEKRA